MNIDLDTRRLGAGLLAAAVRADTDGFDALADDLDDQELHDALMAAVACAAYCIRDTDAEPRLAVILAGAAARYGDEDG